MNTTHTIPAHTVCEVWHQGQWQQHKTKTALHNARQISSEAGSLELAADVEGTTYRLRLPTHQVMVSSSTTPSLYMVSLDSAGAGVRCSCAGFVHHGHCRHLRSSAMQAFCAAWKVLAQCGLSIESINASWTQTRSTTASLGSACARFAKVAADTLAEHNMADRLKTLTREPK